MYAISRDDGRVCVVDNEADELSKASGRCTNEHCDESDEQVPYTLVKGGGGTSKLTQRSIDSETNIDIFVDRPIRQNGVLWVVVYHRERDVL